MHNVLEKELVIYFMDEINNRLVVKGYEAGNDPKQIARQLINIAQAHNVEKVWVWALPEDVRDFMQSGFRLEGSLFNGDISEFCISLAYYNHEPRGNSNKALSEDEIVDSIRFQSITPLAPLPQEITLRLLDQTEAKEISQLLSAVFETYPSPIENPQYIQSLIRNGCIFAGAFHQGNLVSVAAAYPDSLMRRCEITDCATLNDFRGHSLTERILVLLEAEVNKRGAYIPYTLARAQSPAINRVFFKLGYEYRGRLINNCNISGSFQDMNLWVKF